MQGKKFFAVFAALALCVCTSSFAGGKFGIGIQGGFVASSHGYGDTSLTFKIPNVPPVFAVNVGIWDYNLHRIGVTADWWLANPNITGVLNWFYGPGLAVGAAFNYGDGKDFGVYAGARFVVGLNAWVVDFLELYLQAAGQIGVDSLNPQIFSWGIPLNLGIRFWF